MPFARPAWVKWGKLEWIYSVSPEISFRMTPTHSAIIHHHHLSLSLSFLQHTSKTIQAEALEFVVIRIKVGVIYLTSSMKAIKIVRIQCVDVWMVEGYYFLSKTNNQPVILILLLVLLFS